MEDQSVTPEPDPAHTPLFSPYRRTQLVVAIASAVCFILFWHAGKDLHLVVPKGFSASILRQSGWPLDILAIYVLVAAAIAIGTLIAGWAWFFAGLFAGAIGLVALSVLGGPMRYVLFNAASDGSPKSVFLTLIVELILLFVPFALACVHFGRKYDAALPRSEPADEKSERPKTVDSLPLTLLLQFAVTAALLLLLAPTDAKKQVLVGLFIACFGGAAVAENILPDRKAAAWFWVSPLAVGIVGYVLALMNGGDFTTGTAMGMFANLAHPVPLDYAGAGIAGALLGYWSGAERPRLDAPVIKTLLARPAAAAA